MKKISVIIPMYNSEKYIRRCVASVTCQTYRNLEVIVVDDGSRDNGAAVCGEMAEADGRIRLCRQENGGVSAARNHGIDIATGEYLFFLDSDDAIHPLLLEEMLRMAEENRAQLAFCGYRRLDSGGLEKALETAQEELPGECVNGQELSGKCGNGQELPGAAEWPGQPGKPETGAGTFSEKDGLAGWLEADEAGTEEWFHVKYTDIFSGIGGKLILREAVGNLRFDRGLANGEDTFFLYQVVSGKVRSVYCRKEWYYYRMHGESVTNSAGTARGARYFECARRIRDSEYESGHAEHAMRWEILVADQIRRSYTARKGKVAGKAPEGGKENKDAGKARLELKAIAAVERRHPLFRRICFSDRVLFCCCFACYPVYSILNKIALILVDRRTR